MNKFLTRTEINLDITHRCSLECPRCQRSKYKNSTVPGQDLPVKDFEKITDHFDHILFCGQYSDPVHHPEFLKFLEICKDKNVRVSVHNASSAKSQDWYIQAFQVNSEARWVFGIDGLPEQSHIYRVNQDGVKLFDIMKESKKYLTHRPIWQCIVFSYNQYDIEEIKKISQQEEITLNIMTSSRWRENDRLKPTLSEYILKAK